MAKLTPEDCVAQRAPGRIIRRIDRLGLALIESRFPDGRLSFTQWVALKLIRDGVARTPGDLARELGLTTGAITRLIDALEEPRLIGRQRNGSDRRSISLVITDAGREAVNALGGYVVDTWNEVLSDFSMDEFRALMDGLHKLLASIERKSNGVPSLEEAA